ncbi:hypothetical protein SLE2022_238670 [Rubroshorea leprosula]
MNLESRIDMETELRERETRKNVRSRGDTIRQHLVGLYPSTGRWPPDVFNRSSIRFLKMLLWKVTTK